MQPLLGSSRAREIFKRVSRGTHPRSRPRPPSKKISNVLSPSSSWCARMRLEVVVDAFATVLNVSFVRQTRWAAFVFVYLPTIPRTIIVAQGHLFTCPPEEGRAFVDFFVESSFLPGNIHACRKNIVQNECVFSRSYQVVSREMSFCAQSKSDVREGK